MKKKKLTLQEKLAKRKFKSPNPIIHGIYHFIMKYFVMRKYKLKITRRDKISDCKGPCFIIFNHLSRYDHMFVMRAAWPRRYNMVAAYNEFFRSHLSFVFGLEKVIPKKNFTVDMTSLKAMAKVIKSGGAIAFSPEGMSSITGHNQPIVETTGNFLKHYKIPVYMVKLKGSYLTEHKVCLDERLGRVEAETYLLFSPEQLEKMTDQEVNDRINEEFHHDEYEWNKEVKIKWKHDGNICSHFHDLAYKCPKCGEELKMLGDKNFIRCEACGNGGTMDDYYTLTPFNEDCKIFESLSKWVDWERELVIKEISQNPDFSYSVNVKMGCLDKYKTLKKMQTSIPCGEGKLIFDHNGIHFVGVRDGKDYTFELSYEQIYTLILITDVTFFSFYVKGEYLEFTPDIPCVGKILLIVEEMHRLHVNRWKNFPWFDYMYEGIETKTENN